jgi:hypothetical protein
MNVSIVWMYAAIPKHMTDDIFLARILGRKLFAT